MNLAQIKKVYFIGIGGIGMSALARYFKSKRVEVLGSDRDLNSDVVKSLLSENVKVYDQENLNESEIQNHIKNADCIIYTLAIPDDNLELKISKEKTLPHYTYAEMLGLVSKDNFTIAVSGTHGKTTTTAMTGEIAHNLGLNPNIIVGSFMNWVDKNTNLITKINFIGGESNLFIVEACEYKRSFLNLSPNILIITNLEADHLDYYKDLADVKKAFYDLAAKLPQDGKIICQANDPNLDEIVRDFNDKIIDYSDAINKIPEMKIFGEHNKSNAAAAVKAIQSYLYLQNSDIEIESEKVFESIGNFKGTRRRMEYKGELIQDDKNAGAMVYDDYGHHPTEIKVTIKAFQEQFSDKKICLVFQPHLHSRTKMFFDDFVDVLSEVEKVIVYPIYRARAEDDFGVSAKLLVDKINEKNASDSDLDLNLESKSGTDLNSNSELNIAKFSESFDEIAEKIQELNDEWVVILLGAGEVYQIAEKLKFKN